MTRARRPQAGFTLLEVMVAVAILALTLVVLLDIITRNVRSTTHARLTTTATFLARGKMVAIEDVIIEKGFQEIDDFQKGSFGDEGFPEFAWESAIEKIQLPSDLAQKTQQAAGDATTSAQSKNSPMGALTGMVGGLMGGLIEPVRVGLEESVRRVTLRVFWNERGKPEQSVEVALYVTDPSKLDLALALGMAGAGVPGAPGGTSSPGGTQQNAGQQPPQNPFTAPPKR